MQFGLHRSKQRYTEQWAIEYTDDISIPLPT